LALLGIAPPRPGATDCERATFFRDIQIRALALNAIAFGLILLIGPPSWVVLIAAVVLALIALDALRLTLKVRRLRGARTR